MNTDKDVCYELRYIEGQGNGLFAKRNVAAGELIFREFPFVWNAFKNLNNAQSLFCYTCGCSILNGTILPAVCGGCQLCFCTNECERSAVLRGHRFLCPSYKKGGLVDRFTQTDRSGHFVLALQCYGRIAAEYTKLFWAELSRSEQECHVVVKQAAESVLSGYHADDFCRSKHAIRTGKLDIMSENLFETMIAPAYFATSGLEEAHSLIYNAFATLPLSVWTCQCESTSSMEVLDLTSKEIALLTESLRAAFLLVGEDGIFSTMFFRKLIGTFAVNNHHVHLQSEVSPTGTDAIKAEVGPTLAPYVHNEVDVSGTNITTRNPAATVQLLGTALYPTVSKMNHSCECNTTNSHSRRDVQMAVYATAPIAAGQELTTTYLHRRVTGGGTAKPQSRRNRQKALLQYLFTCRCAKCEEELLEEKEERRRRRAAAGKCEDTSSDDEEESSEEEEDEEEDEELDDRSGSAACY